jgi:hypothetical protein
MFKLPKLFTIASVAILLTTAQTTAFSQTYVPPKGSYVFPADRKVRGFTAQQEGLIGVANPVAYGVWFPPGYGPDYQGIGYASTYTAPAPVYAPVSPPRYPVLPYEPADVTSGTTTSSYRSGAYTSGYRAPNATYSLYPQPSYYYYGPSYYSGSGWGCCR